MTRKVCYEINPLKMKNEGFENLSLSEKGIYYELISCAWETEFQFKIQLNLLMLSEQIGCSEMELSFLVSKLQIMGLCYTEIDLESMIDFLVIKDLEEQIIEFNKKRSCEVIDISRIISSKKDSVSKRVVYGEKIEHPEIMYLSRDNRELSLYKGWMPTAGFASSGQVYVLPTALLTSLVDKYPNINLRDQLNMMFSWFAKNPERRQPVGRISAFIYRWCDKASIKMAVSEDAMAELIKKISINL